MRTFDPFRARTCANAVPYAPPKIIFYDNHGQNEQEPPKTEAFLAMINYNYVTV